MPFAIIGPIFGQFNDGQSGRDFNFLTRPGETDASNDVQQFIEGPAADWVREKLGKEAFEFLVKTKDRLDVGQRIFLNPEAGVGEEGRILAELEAANALANERRRALLILLGQSDQNSAVNLTTIAADMDALSLLQQYAVLQVMPRQPAVPMERADP